MNLNRVLIKDFENYHSENDVYYDVADAIDDTLGQFVNPLCSVAFIARRAEIDMVSDILCTYYDAEISDETSLSDGEQIEVMVIDYNYSIVVSSLSGSYYAGVVFVADYVNTSALEKNLSFVPTIYSVDMEHYNNIEELEPKVSECLDSSDSSEVFDYDWIIDDDATNCNTSTYCITATTYSGDDIVRVVNYSSPTPIATEIVEKFLY